MALAQGDLGLLESDIAKRLLSSTVPARLAYTATDGTPRVLPIWFHWTGDELVMCTFVPSPKIAALRESPAVAIMIDTDEFPPESLLIRGCAAITRTATQPAPYHPPPVQWRQQQQWQFNPPAQNQWPDNPNNPGDRPAEGNNNLPPPERSRDR